MATDKRDIKREQARAQRLQYFRTEAVELLQRFTEALNAEGIDFWTVDEFKTFITTLSESKTDFARVADNQVLETVFTLLFYTGIRLGELLALTIADFAAPNNGSYATVSITKSYD